MIIKGIFAVLALIISSIQSVIAGDNEDFQLFLEKHWTKAKQEKVFFCMEGTLPEFNLQVLQRCQKLNVAFLQQLNTIVADKPDKANQVRFKLFRYERMDVPVPNRITVVLAIGIFQY